MFVEDFSTPETEVVVEDEVVKTLRRAAELIRERGWWSDVHGKFGPTALCAMLALGEAASGSRYDGAKLSLCEFVGLARTGQIYGWNDAPERTASDVINALEGAASSRLAALQGKG